MAEPKLVKTIGFYNVIQLDEDIFGLPMGLGSIALDVNEFENHSYAFACKNVDEVVEKIRLNNEMAKEKYEPILLESLGFYNIIGWGAEVYGVPMALGSIKLDEDAIAKNPCLFSGETPDEVIEKIHLNNEIAKEKFEPILKRMFGFYNILGWGADLYGIPVSFGELNLNAIKISDFPSIIKSSNIDDLIKGIEEFCRAEHRKGKILPAKKAV